MSENEFSFVSLCRVSESYNDNNFTLLRLADIYNDKLYEPRKSNRSTNYFENRDWIYRKDGPSTVGTIGVWKWESSPNHKNPETDYVQSHYMQEIVPVRVVMVGANSLDDLIGKLKSGTIHMSSYICDTLFAYSVPGNFMVGALCKAKEFQIIDNFVKLSQDVYTLPYYSISRSEVYVCENDSDLSFLKNVQIEEPFGYFLVGNTDDVICKLILERSTWPLFKECIGTTRAEWKNTRILLEKICNPSLYEVVSQKLNCSYDQAQKYVDEFIIRSNDLIEIGDIDTDVIAKIALHHTGLRVQCEDIVSKKWQETHSLEIQKAETEITAIRNNAEKEIQIYQKRLKDIQAEILSVEERRTGILTEIENAEIKLSGLISEIQRYEVLGQDSMVAVRKKIADAQKDMASFIAELSVFLPNIGNASAPEVSKDSWSYSVFNENGYADEDIEIVENWKDEFLAVRQNLTSAFEISSEFSTIFAAFLYAAYINKFPLLILGPSGSDIAELLSISIYAKNPGHLTIGDGIHLNAVKSMRENQEKIISIQNMFGKGWDNLLPQSFSNLEKQIIWTHPYVEDMSIEPKELYNYMIPVFSECFIENFAIMDPFPGIRSESFEPYRSSNKYPLRINAFKKLGLSKLLLNRLSVILSDAKVILNNPNQEKNLEILCGILPFSVLTGRLDVLREVFENENGISANVKSEIKRFIGEI